MASRLPVVRQISWLATIPQLVVLGICVGLGLLLVESQLGAAWGALAYLVYSFGSRGILLRNHQRGMHLLSVGAHADAIEAFRASYAFLSRQRWLDRFRSVTMMSPSAISYREMALLNIAYALGQSGRGAEAKECYRLALGEFPDSALAKATLKLIESVEQPT
jgi:tetratricopeptide (TPR) repeat protein